MIQVNLDKAKTIAHVARRRARDEEFAPYDKLISAQIPGSDLAAAEASRVTVREKYAQMQSEIDAAKTPEEVKYAAGL